MPSGDVDFRRLIQKEPFLRFLHQEGLPIVWVGGGVRDYLLSGTLNQDWDFATPADPLGLGRNLEAAGWGKIVQTSPLGTVKLRGPHGEVDIARFRKEVYPEPGALPEVRFTEHLEEDLWRRDFTVNAMAVPLSGPDWGRLVDPTGGLRDLERRILRPLHRHSFRDDPTRILRGIRYAVRLRFRLASSFYRQMRAWGDLLAAISFARVRREWMRIAVEASRAEMVVRLARWGLSVPRVRLPSRTVVCVDRVVPREEEAWVFFFALAYAFADVPPPELPHITRRERQILTRTAEVRRVTDPEAAARFLLREDRARWAFWGCLLHLRAPETLVEIPIPDGPTLLARGAVPEEIPELQARALTEALQKRFRRRRGPARR